jgi:hypothetical protein
VLQQFRQSGIAGDYYLEFELHQLPRRGDEQVFQGRLWGSRNEQGAITRVELTDRDGRKSRLLVQNGERAGVWRAAGGQVKQLGAAELFAPLIPGVEVSAFDLQMPFLYWPDATLQGGEKVRGRPANAFLFKAPASITGADVGAVRAYLDTQFNALMQYDVLNRAGRVVKTFSLATLKTIDRQPLPKSVEFRNEVTRDKTRLQVTAAALGLTLGPRLFDPAALTQDVAAPEKLVRLEP